MINKALYTSNKEDWETPDKLYNELNKEFNFTVDLAATEANKKTNIFTNDLFNFTCEDQVCWMNPPYGKEIGKFMAKALVLSKTNTIVCLLPARTDTRWFHESVYGKAELRFLKGRVKFKGGQHSAPFPSMLAIYRLTNE